MLSTSGREGGNPTGLGVADCGCQCTLLTDTHHSLCQPKGILSPSLQKCTTIFTVTPCASSAPSVCGENGAGV